MVNLKATIDFAELFDLLLSFIRFIYFKYDIFFLKNIFRSEIGQNDSETSGSQKMQELHDGHQEIKGSLGKMEEALKSAGMANENNQEDMRQKLVQINAKLVTIDIIAEKVTDVTSNSFISSAIREVIRCKVCSNIPKDRLIASGCCGQILGCGICIQECIHQKDMCILCNHEGMAECIVELKCFTDILSKLDSGL